MARTKLKTPPTYKPAPAAYQSILDAEEKARQASEEKRKAEQIRAIAIEDSLFGTIQSFLNEYDKTTLEDVCIDVKFSKPDNTAKLYLDGKLYVTFKAEACYQWCNCYEQCNCVPNLKGQISRMYATASERHKTYMFSERTNVEFAKEMMQLVRTYLEKNKERNLAKT